MPTPATLGDYADRVCRATAARLEDLIWRVLAEGDTAPWVAVCYEDDQFRVVYAETEADMERMAGHAAEAWWGCWMRVLRRDGRSVLPVGHA